MAVVALQIWYFKHVLDMIAQGRIALVKPAPHTPDIDAVLGLLNAARARQPLGSMVLAQHPDNGMGSQKVPEYTIVDGRARCEALARVFLASSFEAETSWPVYALPFDRMLASTTLAWGTQDEAGALPLSSLRQTQHFMKWEANLRDREPDPDRVARVLDDAHTLSLQLLNAPVPVYVATDWTQDEVTQMRQDANARFAVQ